MGNLVLTMSLEDSITLEYNGASVKLRFKRMSARGNSANQLRIAIDAPPTVKILREKRLTEMDKTK